MRLTFPILTGLCFFCVAKLTHVSLVTSSDRSYLKLSFNVGAHKHLGLVFGGGLLEEFDAIQQYLGDFVFLSGYLNKGHFLNITFIDLVSDDSYRTAGKQFTLEKAMSRVNPFRHIDDIFEEAVDGMRSVPERGSDGS